LYFSVNIIRVTKSRKKRWAGHVTRKGDFINVQKFYSKNLNGRGHFGDMGINGRVLLKWN